MKTHFNRTHSSRSHVPLAFLAKSALLVGALGATPALAQSADEPPLIEGAWNVQRFSPAPGPRNFITTRGARTDGEHAFSFGLAGNFGKDPFIVGTQAGDTFVVQGVVSGDLWFAYTPAPIVQLGLRLPLTYAKGNGVNPVDGSPGNLADPPLNVEGTGLSDPELEAKFRIVGEVKDPFVFGGAVFLGAPLGEATAEGSYIGTESVVAGARLIADLDLDPLIAAANLGYRYKDEGRINETEFGPDLIYGLGVGVRATPSFHILADLFGSSQFSDDPSTNAAELDAALRIAPVTSSWSLHAGGGIGLAQGSVGVPAYRALLGFGYSFESSDEDGDGKEDGDDACPTEPEDLDGFEDGDGCPELDNDADGIKDDADKCPRQAEDVDGNEDTDGCPDNDDDGDGIRDVSDRCPSEPENMNGFEDEDGCPDVADGDSDGVPDDKDECPDASEDTDGFQDTDGCPDLDNDGDGIPDDRDECVDEAEDDPEDQDGCPG